MNTLSKKLMVAFFLVSIISMGMMALLAQAILKWMLGYDVPGMHMMSQFMGVSPERFFQALNASYLLSGLIAILISFVSGYLVVFIITRPLRKLSEAAQHIANGHLNERVQVTSEDELGQLANSFNQMAASLEEAEQNRKALYADIVHELRHPLTVARCRTEAMLDGMVPVSNQELQSIHHELLTLARLITDLRDLSLAQNGKLTLQKQETDLQEFLSRIVEETQVLAKEKGITLSFISDSKMPKLEIDPERLSQVMHNLLSNAIRHTPDQGTITVEMKKASKEVVISVQDTGTGIPKEELEKIFDRFYRVDRSRSRSTGGSGLGLAIVKQLIHLHGGSVWVESQVGKGTRFSFSLPMIDHTQSRKEIIP